MDKDQQFSSVPSSEPNSDKHSLREQQAQEIMQQLVTEGILAPDEAAEVTFSNTAFICIPDTEQKPADTKGVK